ncbi:hypothetical protein L0F63_001721 [Massospora cicadina]|nr:hypothetical protein L0F63_001721 [Massospora cicadina]
MDHLDDPGHLPEEFYLNAIQYQNRDKETFSHIQILMRDLVRCFSAPVLDHRHTVCGIVEGQMLTICCLLITPLQEFLGRVTFCFPSHLE